MPKIWKVSLSFTTVRTDKGIALSIDKMSNGSQKGFTIHKLMITILLVHDPMCNI